MNNELIELLKSEGYYNLKEIKGRGLCGISRFAFTVGLSYGLNEVGRDGRYCYERNADAVEALNNWDGTGDPKDNNWIKHKGYAEYSNPAQPKRF